jgi:hypothetical protein
MATLSDNAMFHRDNRCHRQPTLVPMVKASKDNPSDGRGRFSAKAWEAIEVLEKEMEQLGCRRLVLQPHKKFERALAYSE